MLAADIVADLEAAWPAGQRRVHEAKLRVFRNCFRQSASIRRQAARRNAGCSRASRA
jgi:hypothetical protein